MGMLEVRNVSKRFGSNQVIDNLNFAVEEGCIYGFIGENGAGKTTTMKMILGLYTTDEGEIWVNGERVIYGQNRTNKYIGYLPDVPEFYGYMTPREYLKLCGDITGVPKRVLGSRIDETLNLVGLKSGKRIQGFSRGMKQRLGIAQALLNKPKLLICDEPTSALDPVGRKEILDILTEAKKETTVIFSTHILTDVERICDNIGILNKGNLVYEGTMEDVRKASHSHSVSLDFDSEYEMDRALETLSNSDVTVKRICKNEEKLEEFFMEVTGK